MAAEFTLVDRTEKWLATAVAAAVGIGAWGLVSLASGSSSSPTAASSPAPLTTQSTSTLLTGYVGQDENSVMFLQLQPAGHDHYVGTGSETLWEQGISRPTPATGAISADVSGSQITVNWDGASTSGRRVGADIIFGFTDNQVGYHEVTFVPGDGASYQASIARFQSAWDASAQSWPTPSPS